MLTKILNNGVEIPMLGFGTFKVTDPAECEASILEAIRAGYRLIDTAAIYGNEAQVGAGIRAAIDRGLVTREELFVITKVWFTDFETEACRSSIQRSMELLGLDTLDMVLLHWPYGNVYAAWRVLEEYYAAGRIRAIGVSNMSAGRVIDLIRNNRVPPALNQIETNLYCQQREQKVWLDKYGVAQQAYAPLGQGRANEMFTEPAVQAIARKYGKTAAQVLLRFLVDSGVIALPKSVHAQRIRENIDIFDFALTAEEQAALAALNRRVLAYDGAEDPVRVERFLK